MRSAAQIAGEGFEEFQRQAHGAKSVGIEFDKLGDIFKDVRERVGDFVATGGGPMADFFENIGPKVGITADAFKGLSGKDGLQLYYDSLVKAGVSSEEMSFYLEAMASDTTALIPLLKDGGKAFDELGDKAAVISEEDAAGFKKLTDAQLSMSAATRKLTIALANSGILDAITGMIERVAAFTDKLSKTNPAMLKLGVVVGGVVAALGPALIIAGSMVSAFGKLWPILSKLGVVFKVVRIAALALMANPAILAFAAVVAGIYLAWQNWDKIQPIIDSVGKAISGWWSESVKPSLDAAKAALGVVADFFRDYFGDQVKGTVQLISGLMTGDFADAWEGAKLAVSGMVNTALALVRSLAPGAIESMRAMYVGIKNWIQDKLGSVFNWLGSKIEWVANKFKWLDDVVVRNSYIPDMVDSIGEHMGRLVRLMIDPAQKAADGVAAAMAGIGGQIALPSVSAPVNDNPDSQEPGVSTPANDNPDSQKTSGTFGAMIGLTEKWQTAIQNIGDAFGGVGSSISAAT